MVEAEEDEEKRRDDEIALAAWFGLAATTAESIPGVWRKRKKRKKKRKKKKDVN